MTDALVEFLEARLDEDEWIAREAGSRRIGYVPDGEHWRWEHAGDGEVPDLDADASAEIDVVNGHHGIDRWPVALRSVEVYETGTVGELQHEVIPQLDEMGAREARYIARHDPARVLADVAAKRAILMEYRDAVAARDADETDVSARIGVFTLERLVIRRLVQVWADHPDFDPAWKVNR